MSNTDALRDALKGASEALTTADLSDLAELDRGTTAKLLYAMTESGEVIKQEGEDGGKPTYLRNPEFVPKRQAAAEPEAPVVAKTRRAKKVVAKKARKAPRKAKAKAERKPPKPARKKPRKAAPTPAPAAAEAPASASPLLTQELQRAVRLLIAHAMRGDEALDAETREAVLIVLPEVA